MPFPTKTVLLLIVVVLALLFVPLPRVARLGNAVQDLGHVPIGALLAVVIWGVLRQRFSLGVGSALILTCVLVGAGLTLVEVVQPFFGRGRSRQDLATGILGAGGALAIILARGRAGVARVGGWLLGLGLLGVAAWPGARVAWDAVRQYSAAPLLASFEDDLEMTRWDFEDVIATRSTQHATHATWSLQVDLEPAPHPTVAFNQPPRDWRERTAFAFDAYLEGETSLDVVIKIVDEAHECSYDSRYNGNVTLEPGSNQIRIPMDEIARGPRSRPLDLDRIVYVHIATYGLREKRTLYLDHVRWAGRVR